MSCKMPEGYLNPEVRDGEFLDTKKKKLFKVSLEILEEIKSICEKHNLQWFAAYGTLLGAVRHKGFIPWDDDIDLWMTRSDLIKFEQVARMELPSHYAVQTQYSDPDYEWDIVKIRDSKTTMLADKPDGRKMNMGIWVSIFPLDGRPQTDNIAQGIFRIKWFYERIWNMSSRRRNKTMRDYVRTIAAKFLVALLGGKELLRVKACALVPKVSEAEFCTSMSYLHMYNWMRCPSWCFKDWKE